MNKTTETCIFRRGAKKYKVNVNDLIKATSKFPIECRELNYIRIYSEALDPKSGFSYKRLLSAKMNTLSFFVLGKF